MNAALQSSGASAEHPFPGLRPFAYQDNAYFFGREDQNYALYRLIDRYRFTAVIGSSGSGKSSLVRAGLLPLLDTETRDSGGRNWLWREMRPGDAPLQRMANLLAGLSVDDDLMVASGRRDRIVAQLHRSSFGISEALADSRGIADKSVVLVIDQFEELFRYAAVTPGKDGPSGDEIRARDEATQFVQLLLEASGGPSNRTTIILTMRSDFIGDCARFHGLPAAVSAAQFLVPALTRDQLDDVIRKPVEQAGATIDPELVERLLNDCSTEMDQLPVLQHCLSRLWDQAGRTPAVPKPPDAAPAGLGKGAQPGGARRLSLNHYRDIGEFAEALSRHADEILKDLRGPTLQLAVEQVFSALSELDKEGRAIRRSLRFSQLVAETGVDEAAVRRVLDRFRADDCCFLTPPPFEVKEINGATRIDVGHEALLRRWEKVSGRGADLGWLRAEQQAGERYRSLLAMAEGDDAVLPSHLVDERWAWWTARPRTEAWAERYGGGFARVQRLLLASRRRQSAKRWLIAAAFLLVMGAAGAMFLLWQNARQSQADANANRKDALEAVQNIVGKLTGFLNDGTIRAIGAQQFLDNAQETLDHLAREGEHTPEISNIEIHLMLDVSDVKDALGDYDGATEFASKAEQYAQHLVTKYPDDPEFKHLVFAGKFRIGDQLAKHIRDNANKAFGEYSAALDIALQLASAEPANLDRQRDVAFARNKLGDIHKYKAEWPAALEEYQFGLKIAEAIATKYPGDTATQMNRIAQVYGERNAPGDVQAALDEYRQALAIQTAQLNDKPGDTTLISNIALTHRRIGSLSKGNPDDARLEYEAAVKGRQKLYDSDPGNAYWQSGLATDSRLLGDVLMQKQNWRGASQSYSTAIRMAEGFVSKNLADVGWQTTLADLNVKRGDALVRRGREVIDQPELPVDESSRLTKTALDQYRSAEATYQNLAKAGKPRDRDLFDLRIKIGDVLVQQGNFKDALIAYQTASAAADQAALTQRVVDWQVKLAEALEQAGDGLYRLAGPAGGDPAFFQKALEAVEAAAAKEPDNPDLQTRKAALTAKIEVRKSSQ